MSSSYFQSMFSYFYSFYSFLLSIFVYFMIFSIIFFPKTHGLQSLVYIVIQCSDSSVRYTDELSPSSWYQSSLHPGTYSPLHCLLFPVDLHCWNVFNLHLTTFTAQFRIGLHCCSCFSISSIIYDYSVEDVWNFQHSPFQIKVVLRCYHMTHYQINLIVIYLSFETKKYVSDGSTISITGHGNVKLFFIYLMSYMFLSCQPIFSPFTK